uniref:Neurotransmitter-gated ion-channel ligand-binding domain-containing protein n=1 Tax=Cacopsylla melanoneura TaxID=428564 RepID=A0A8D8SP09_9HEMI
MGGFVFFGLCAITCLLTLLTPTVGQEIPDVPDNNPCRSKTSIDVDFNEQIMGCLRKSIDYNVYLNQTIDVNINILTENIFFSDRVHVFYFFGRIGLSWNDPNLRWSKNDFPQGTVITRFNPGLWKPDLYVNALTNFDSGRRLANNPVVSQASTGAMIISNTGTVMFHSEITLWAYCPQTDFTYFPYDVKECRIELFSPSNIRLVTRGINLINPFYLSSPSDLSYQLLATNLTSGPSDNGGNGSSSVILYFKMLRFDESHNVKLHTPNLGLCLFLLIPLWLSPRNPLRLILPTICFLFTLYQMQLLNTMLGKSVFAGPILMLDFYQAIIIISLLMIIHNFYSCLIWRRKVFLPTPLNRFYAHLYANNWFKQLTEARSYFEFEQDCQENTENLEAIFHTWSELLRLVDVLLIIIVMGVEVFYYRQTIFIGSSPLYQTEEPVNKIMLH